MKRTRRGHCSPRRKAGASYNAALDVARSKQNALNSGSTSLARPTPGQPAWLRAAPFIFLVLWSGGFIALKFGLAYADPLTFLALRYLLVVLLLALPFAMAIRPLATSSERDVTDGWMTYERTSQGMSSMLLSATRTPPLLVHSAAPSAETPASMGSA